MNEPDYEATATQLKSLHPLLQRLVAETGATILDDAESFDAWAARAGVAMVVFAEDPERYKETLDLAVVVPELHATAGRRFRVGLLPPAASRLLAPRYGFARWPAFVMLLGGKYLGAVDGIRDWEVYVGELNRLLAAAPTRPPTVGIAVKALGEGDAAACH